MLYYSTRHNAPDATLEQAVLKGLAADGGLYMPRTIPRLPRAFYSNLKSMSLQEIAYAVINYALQGDVEAGVLHDLVKRTLTYDMPLREVEKDRWVMELFHGPTMTFKDVGVQFMGGLLDHYNHARGNEGTVNVLVATSGDTGSAVATSFARVPGVKVWALYPQDSLSPMQEAQFATQGGNIHAVEVNGTFDDCKELVETAFMDRELNEQMILTTATSMNVARIIPQTVYYFAAYAHLSRQDRVPQDGLVMAVPCGNLGNLVSGLVARKMGLPVKRLVAVENDNNIFHDYIETGKFVPKPSLGSIAPAMDAGNPTNFERIVDITGSLDDARQIIHARAYTDQQVINVMNDVYKWRDYVLDPHSAFAYRGLLDDLEPGEVGVSLATAHPAKFATQTSLAIGREIEVPSQLRGFMGGTRQVTTIKPRYRAFKALLQASKG